MPPTSQTLWLRIGAALVISSGALVLLGAHPVSAGPLHLVADLLFWPLDGGQAGSAEDTRLLAAIGGGVMLGWGVMIWQMSGALLTLAPGPTRRVLMSSLIVWFLADSAASVAAGAALNVVGNLAFLVLFTLALRPAAPAQTSPVVG